MKHMLALSLVGLLATAVSVSAQIVVTPTSLNLGTIDRGSGAAANVKVRNGFPTDTSFTVGFQTQSGNFSVGTSPFTLAPNQEKTLFLNIEAGSSPGNYSGTFTISGGGQTVTVPVTATVIDALATTISPNLLDFGTVVVGQSKPLTINVTNTSPGPLTYSGVGNPSLYTVSPASLPLSPNQTGTLTVTFAPGNNTGNLPGVLSVKANNNTVGSPQLKGFGAIPPGSIQVSPATLDFGDVNRSSGAASSYTVTNGSSSTLNLSFQRTGNFSTSTSPVSLAAGQSKTQAVNVEAGAGPGQLNGAVTVSAAGQSATVTLRANVLEPPPPDLTVAFQSTTPVMSQTRLGRLATFTLTIQNSGQGTVSASFAVKMFLDNVLVKTATVSPGQLPNVSVGFVVPANTTGSHSVRAEVDANNQITESNESNNAVTASVTF